MPIEDMAAYQRQRRLDLLAKGMCPAHPKNKLIEGTHHCARCASRRTRLLADGMCPKHKDEPVLEGTKWCAKCAEARSRKVAEGVCPSHGIPLIDGTHWCIKCAEAKMHKKAWLKENHICVYCEKNRLTLLQVNSGKLVCSACLCKLQYK